MITKINGAESDIKLHIYPNPSNHIITVATTEAHTNGFISLYSISGQVLIKQRVQGNKTKVDISTLNAGIYFVKYGSKNQVLKTSFIKE